MSHPEDLLAQIALAQGQVTPLQLFDAYQEKERQGGKPDLLAVLQAQGALTPADGAAVKSAGGARQLSLEESVRLRMADVFTALSAAKSNAVRADTLRGGLLRLPSRDAAPASIPDILLGMGWIKPDAAQALRSLQAINFVTCETCRWILRAREKEAPPKTCSRCQSAVVRWKPPAARAFIPPPSAAPVAAARPASASRPAARSRPASAPASAGTDDATLAEIPVTADADPAPTLIDEALAPGPRDLASAPGPGGFQDSATIAEFTPPAVDSGEPGFQDSATICDDTSPAAAADEPGFQDSATICDDTPPAAAAGEPGFQNSATLAEIAPPTTPRAPKGLDASSFGLAADFSSPAPTSQPTKAQADSGATVCDVDAPEIGELRNPAADAPADVNTTVADLAPPATQRVSSVARSGGAAPSSPSQSPVVKSGPAGSEPRIARSTRPGNASPAGTGSVAASAPAPSGTTGTSAVDATRTGKFSVPPLPGATGASDARRTKRPTARGFTPDVLSQIKQSGKIFGNYYLLEKLGQGGMGTVYKGYDTKFKRYVAVKLLTQTAGESDAMVARFILEAQSAAKLRHANIMPVHDYGCINNSHYLVMDYCEGHSLDREIRSKEALKFPKGQQPPDGRNPGLEVKAALKILRDVCSAVDLAHRNNIIHRDLKPANILVSPDGGIMLTDFGLARDLSEESVRLTKSGITLGTPLYMSPEQGAGETKGVDGRSDIYSLGAIAYELFTGRPPFEGTDTMAVLVKHMHLEPTPPSSLVKNLDPQIETVILKCLEKDKGRRYATSGELAEDWDCLLRGEPIRSQAPSVMHRVRRWRRRNKAAVAALFVVVACIGIASFLIVQRIALEKDKDRAAELAQVQERLNGAKVQLAQARAKVAEALAARRQGNFKSVEELVGDVGKTADEALRLDPALLDAEVVRAEALRVAGRWDEALAALAKVFHRDARHGRARWTAGGVHLDTWYCNMVDARLGGLGLARLVVGPAPAGDEIARLVSPASAESARPELDACRKQAIAEFGQVPIAGAAESAVARGLADLLADPAKASDALARLRESAGKQDEFDEALLGIALAHEWLGDEMAALDAYAGLVRRDQGQRWLYRDRVALAVLAALRTQAGGDTLVKALRDALGDLDRIETIDPDAASLAPLRPWILWRIATSGRASPADARQALESAHGFLSGMAATAGAAGHFLRGDVLARLASLQNELKEDPTPALEDAAKAYTQGLESGANPRFLEARAETRMRLAHELRQRSHDSTAALVAAIADFATLIHAAEGSRNAGSLRSRRGAAWLGLAEVFIRNGAKEDPIAAFESAAADLTAAFEKNPQDMTVLRLRIRAYAGMSGHYGMTRQVDRKLEYARLNEADCAVALESTPDDPELLQLLGNAESAIATHWDIGTEERSKYIGLAEKHYHRSIELGNILPWNDLAMLYWAIGNEGRALSALKKFSLSLPKPDPDIEDQIARIEQDYTIKRELDEGRELAMRGEYEKAEEKYVEGHRKVIGYLRLVRPEELAAVLAKYSSNLAVTSYDLACIYAQASIGKAGMRDRATKPDAKQAQAYVDKAFAGLDQALYYCYGWTIGAGGTMAQDERLNANARKDPDLEPLRKDPRWKAFLEKLDTAPKLDTPPK